MSRLPLPDGTAWRIETSPNPTSLSRLACGRGLTASLWYGRFCPRQIGVMAKAQRQTNAMECAARAPAANRLELFCEPLEARGEAEPE